MRRPLVLKIGDGHVMVIGVGPSLVRDCFCRKAVTMLWRHQAVFEKAKYRNTLLVSDETLGGRLDLIGAARTAVA